MILSKKLYFKNFEDILIIQFIIILFEIQNMIYP